MFYVISGYCGPDNYTSDDGPILTVKEYQTAEAVEKAYAEFQGGLGRECSLVTFRVIEGKERKIAPKEVVTKYELK